MTRLERENQTIEFSEVADIYLNENDSQIIIHCIGTSKSVINVIQSGNKTSKELQPGEVWRLSLEK